MSTGLCGAFLKVFGEFYAVTPIAKVDMIQLNKNKVRVRRFFGNGNAFWVFG